MSITIAQWMGMLLIVYQLHLMSRKDYVYGWYVCIAACFIWGYVAAMLGLWGLLVQQIVITGLAVQALRKLL